MAKKALLDVLEQTIGKYVKNLDAESLNVALWSGKIELSALELDVDSVNAQLQQRAVEAPNLALPFRVLSGRFESFQVDVPWAHITSRPVVLRARGLSVEVEPVDNKGMDAVNMDISEEAEVIRLQKLKEAREEQLESANQYRLQAYNVRKIALAEERENDADKGNTTFTSRLVRRIIENIQVEITDVHVSLMDADGSVGVCLASLRLMTTDKEGEQVFVDRTGGKRDDSLDKSFLYKMLQIDGLGIYLDEDEFSNARKSLHSIGELSSTDSGESDGAYPCGLAADHSYILAPLSFEARLRQADSNVCLDYAKYHLRSQLSSLSILLNRSQLDFARKLSKVMSKADTGPKPLFPEYRPLVRIKKGTAKEWWRYVVRCIGRLNGRRSWVEFFLSYQKRKTYIPLFKRQSHHRDCSWIKPLSSKEMDVLVHIESDRSISIEGLMSWRNIADAQVDKEKQKYDEQVKSKETGKKSYYSYLFGSSPTEAPTDNTGAEENEEVAIVLSDEEMRELEGLARVDLLEKELSKDSKLYDFEFVMGSFKVDLVAYDLRHVASLDMGQVSTSFDAAMDGAFTFDFELSDLEIFDRATPQSIFPSVLKLVDQPNGKGETKAVQFNLSKSSGGDRSLALKVATFEAIASQLMVQEVQRFFRATAHKPVSKLSRKANPMLAQSISGSVDLFYDAEPGESFILPEQEISKEEKERKPLMSRYDLSNALIDAWKEKTETKVSWRMDVDIHAPVILIPEMCSDPRANVLVFDLGNLRLKYGKYKPSLRIRQWFLENPRETLSEESYDCGTLSISDLTFAVQKAGLWQARSTDDPKTLRESAIIDPTGLAIDFAIETVGSEGNPRFCMFGVIPTISLTVSPSQSSRILPVVTSWRNVFSTEGGNERDLFSDSPSSESSSSEDTPESLHSVEQHPSGVGIDAIVDVKESEIDTFSTFYCNLGLQRLSVTLVEEGRKQLEAHLVSVYASVVQSSDNSYSVGFRMGWFWILDWMESDFQRRQKLVVHSNLPRSARHFSETNDYDILEELKKGGVFEKDYAGSTDLADVAYRHLPVLVDRNEHDSMKPGVETVLDAKFHCLFVHWNPQAIKGINALIDRFLSAVDDDRFSDAGTLIMSPGKSNKDSKISKPSRQGKETQHKRILVKAEMESLNVILNSALDDLPLFCLEVAGTSVSVIPRGSGREISLGLGDVRITTQSGMGETLPEYRTLLGLASGRSESLLTVRYCAGYDAVTALDVPLNKIENMEAVATVDLSPMRFCYIHSQIMTIVEYVTDGILGALTAQAATSAAEAAKELANSVSGGSLFTIKATSLDLLMPQAAYRDEHLGVNTSSLDVDFYMFNDSRGSHVEIGLSSVVLRDTLSSKLQKAPIQMSLGVEIPPYGVGDANQQAMSVTLNISEASFVLTKIQYAQILNTLDENIGEASLFLRDDDIAGLTVDTSATAAKPGEMTHAGAKFEERTRRLYLTVGIKELSLALYGRTTEDPIVQLRAVNARIKTSQFPDLGKSSTMVSLQNLFCEDSRDVAQGRQYRYLIDQTEEIREDVSSDNIFQIEYTSEKDKSNLNFALGSPRVVLIPDVISEIVSFTNIKRKKKSEPSREASKEQVQEEGSPLEHKVVQVDSNENDESVEAHLRSSNTFVSTIAAKTGTCRFVLVDLGSQLSVDTRAIQDNSTGSSSSTAQLTETVILQGIFSAVWSTESDLETGKKVSAEFQAHSDAMEMFTAFGREMKSPLQILEPAEASAHGSLKTIGSGETEIEVRAAALTAMEFSLSMHNAALLSAIMTSLGESFRYAEEKEAAEAAKEQQLSLREQQRIEQLADALAKIGEDESLSILESGSSHGDSVTSSSFYVSEPLTPSTTKYQIKLTMPQTRITFINDLQGLDEALFRVSVTNFVAGGELVSPKTLFDFHCNTSILADYFDNSVNLWSRLLIKPWEITTKGIRAASRRFRSNRLSSSLDLESFPCCISFSEQFLVSLASAARMWSIYTAAKSGPYGEDLGTDGSSKSIMMTASAARNLITSFPHAVANHSGLDASFSLRGGSIEKQACPTGNTKYFRFDPPKGEGFGGRRAYGQDVEVQKLVEIFVEGKSILVNMDAELGISPSANPLGHHRVLFTHVVKEGKTTVSTWSALNVMDWFPFGSSL
jgi:vacuolar protein sorting-associated protein 13A/C